MFVEDAYWKWVHFTSVWTNFKNTVWNFNTFNIQLEITENSALGCKGLKGRFKADYHMRSTNQFPSNVPWLGWYFSKFCFSVLVMTELQFLVKAGWRNQVNTVQATARAMSYTGKFPHTNPREAHFWEPWVPLSRGCGLQFELHRNKKPRAEGV